MIDDPAFGAVVRDYLAHKVYGRLNDPAPPMAGL